MTEKTIAERTRDALIAKHKQYVNDITSVDTASEPAASVAEPAVVEVAPAIPVADNQRLYSDLFDCDPSMIAGGDFAITCYKDSDWDDEGQAFIPSMEKFKTFVLNHQVLAMEMRALEHNLKVLVVGPSGSGKTTLQEFICAAIRQPYLRINGHQKMESDSLLGKPWVRGGVMEFDLGELPKKLQQGWFVAFDEPWKTPPGVQMCLQRMYERGGILQLDDMPGTLAEKQIVPHPRFRMVLCDNVVGTGDNSGKYGATMIQDGSTLNRIDVVLHMDYLKHDDEVNMLLTMHPALDKGKGRVNCAARMVSLASLLRRGYDQDELSAAMSPRNLDSWAMLTVSTGSPRLAFEMTILGRYGEEDERAAVQEHYRNVFG